MTAAGEVTQGRLQAVLATGTGLKNYFTESSAYTDVDSANLSVRPLYVPRGFIAAVTAGGLITSLAGTPICVAIADNGATAVEQTATPPNPGAGVPFSLQYGLAGDDAAHVFALQFSTTASGRVFKLWGEKDCHPGAAQIFNNGRPPFLLVELMPESWKHFRLRIS